MGLSALLVSTDWAMLEPLHGGTSDRMALRFFVFVSQTFDINNRTLEPKVATRDKYGKETLF